MKNILHYIYHLLLTACSNISILQLNNSGPPEIVGCKKLIKFLFLVVKIYLFSLSRQVIGFGGLIQLMEGAEEDVKGYFMTVDKEKKETNTLI